MFVNGECSVDRQFLVMSDNSEWEVGDKFLTNLVTWYYFWPRSVKRGAIRKEIDPIALYKDSLYL